MELYLNQVGQRISDLVGGYIPTLLAALLILIVGWILALIIAKIAGKIFHHSGFNERLNNLTKETNASITADFKSENWVKRLTFWFVMLFVFIGFFQVLGISKVTEPLNQLLSKVFDYIPLLLGAGILFVIAWIIASVMKYFVNRALSMVKLEERLKLESDADSDQQLPLIKSIANTVYWLIFLLFLPAILGALQLQGLLIPVQEMLYKILAYLPNIFGATIVLVIGWFLARILQNVTTNLTASFGIDRVVDKMGITETIKNRKLSVILGFGVYFFVLIPVLIAAINVLGLDAISSPTTLMLNTVMTSIPSIFAGLLVITIAYFVGKVVVGLLVNLLTKIGFNNVLVKLGFNKELTQASQTPSEIVGYIVMVAIMFIASIEAAHLMNFSWLVTIGSELTIFFGHVLLGIVIFGLGLYIANLVYNIVLKSRSSQAGFLAIVSKVSILILTGAMALRQMGLAEEIVNLAFGLLLGAIAVAVAIAFGLGGKDLASKELGSLLNKTKMNMKEKDGN